MLLWLFSKVPALPTGCQHTWPPHPNCDNPKYLQTLPMPPEKLCSAAWAASQGRDRSGPSMADSWPWSWLSHWLLPHKDLWAPTTAALWLPPLHVTFSSHLICVSSLFIESDKQLSSMERLGE